MLRLGQLEHEIRRKTVVVSPELPQLVFRVSAVYNPDMTLLERIDVDPDVCHGAPRVKGTRIMVQKQPRG